MCFVCVAVGVVWLCCMVRSLVVVFVVVCVFVVVG